jgi:hypothetical protein
MAFFHGPFRAPSLVRVRGAVFAIGRRVYVACPGDRRARVTLTDGAGAVGVDTLADGSEVEILAWRPHAAETRYRVRSTRDGFEGWLAAGSLRSARSAVASVAKGPTPPTTSAARRPTLKSGPITRRLGKRSA